MIRMFQLQIKRIYASPAPTDGHRILVDRLWPRGVRKTESGLDGWAKTVSPSAELRKSFAHRPERFGEFRKAYRDELDGNPEASAFARSCGEMLASGSVTLLYAAKDETCNNAAVLCEWVREQIERRNRNGF